MASSSGGSGPQPRAFAQKLTRAHAHDIRRQTAAELKSSHVNDLSGPGSAQQQQQRHLANKIGRSSVHFQVNNQTLSPNPSLNHSFTGDGHSAGHVEPLDYEEYIHSQSGRLGERDPLAHLLEFPRDDIEVSVVPKKIRTMGHIMPEEPMDQVDSTVQNCVECYTSDYVVVTRKYQGLSSSIRTRDESEERLRIIDTVPPQEFEVDDSPDVTPEFENLLRSDADIAKSRRWRNSLNAIQPQLSMPNSLGGSRHPSLLSLSDEMYLPRSSSLSSISRFKSTSVMSFASVKEEEDIFIDESLQFLRDTQEEDGDCTPTNNISRSPQTPYGRTSSKLDSNHLTDLLEAMSTSHIIREKKRASAEKNREETPRGSWATFDLRNSQPDPPIAGLLDKVDPETTDHTNALKRNEHRQNELFLLYPPQADVDVVERRFNAEEPTEHIKHRILVQCIKLELSLQVEPIFATMALYDAKEKKKISENFYFDMNSENIRRMLEGYIPHADYSTQARSCVFDITYPTQDLFLVVKLEKVLQGDISDAAEPYLKESQNMDKIRSNASEVCHRLGKYRMPFAWTAIWLQNIIKGKENNQDSGSDAESTASNSLDRKASTSSFEQFRKSATKSAGDSTNSLTRRGSFDRKRSSWAGGGSASSTLNSGASEEVMAQLDSFPPLTLTVSSFFKQEGDKLKDEDLYKFLLDLKRPSTALKRLKCIRGTLKLDISVASDQVKHCFTPELAKLIPFPDLKSRPTKEILELPPKEILEPNYHFRNLLYICPKDLNFTNRSGERARNIAIKVQFMGQDETDGLKVIFGKSSCPEFTSEAYTAVTYHNKTPDFYEEVKVKLPSNLRERHHILFTFYHISCQGQRKDQISTEIPVGYSWIPIFRNGSLQTGLYDLPVMLDPPAAALRYIATDSGGAPPGTKWVDNKKPIFSVELIAASTIHPLDPYIDRFLNLTSSLQLGPPSSTNQPNERAMEDDLLRRLQELSRTRLEPLVKFLPVVLDKLLLLMVKPPTVAGHTLKVSQPAFHAIAGVVHKLSTSTELQHQTDRHRRNCLLTAYIQYQAHLPHPDFRGTPSSQNGSSSTAPGISLLADDEVGNIIMKGQSGSPALDNVAGMRNDLPNLGAFAKLVHEELALQWSISSGPNREVALACAWFFLELMIKAMIEHLATTSRLGVSRKHRFSEQFHTDVVSMVASLTSDIVCRQKQDPEMVERLNSSLAFFLHDLLSVMDRGFVFSLIRSYMKDVSSRMTTTIAESLPLWNLQLDFVRIVCSHEHFVALNLPSVNPSWEFHHLSGASSPTPSVRSTDSQSSFIAHSYSSGTEKTHWADLTNEFRKRHFLVGLVLSLLSNAMEQPSFEVHGRAVNAVRNLLSSHDSDPRFKDVDCRARVASLYLPFISILMDHLPKLYSWPTEGEVRIAGPNNPSEQFNMILSSISSNLPHAKGPIVLKEETTRHLLICFLWIIKHLDKSVLRLWWSELSHHKLQILLEILRLTISCFQYKKDFQLPEEGGATVDEKEHPRSGTSSLTDEALGHESLSYLALETRLQFHFSIKGKKAIRRHATLGVRKSSDMRSRLEDIISGPTSNRQEMLSRISRKERTLPPSPNPDFPPPPPPPSGPQSNNSGVGRRWQRTSILRPPSHVNEASFIASGSTIGEGGLPKIIDPETDAHIEGVLSTEASMLVLDTLEVIVQIVSQTDHAPGLLASVLRVLLHALGTHQSTFFLQHLFAVQRSFVFKFPSLLFDDASEHCADLCLRLLKHCSSSISAVRSQASASLYLLMRQNFEIGNNFARVKMQVTMSLSKLVGTISNFNEDYLRKSLKTILVYAEKDHELSDTSFPEQVQDLVFNLHMILSDTVKMKEYNDDPEMHMDLMFRIAKGYQNSPDLRLTWLESMATKHEHLDHFAEAGMCKIHCAALISEYLHMLEDRKYMPTGAVTFATLTPNALEESAVSDDVVSPDEEGICTGKNFTEAGLIAILDDAARCFNQAGMFETVNEVFKASIPIAENSRNFLKLADIHKDLHEAFKSIDRLRGKRMFGTYFRVGFYGARFGDLDGEEYIYKEKALAKLPEIAQRLENFYGDKFGRDNVSIIKDSKMVELSKLNPEKAYIQITYVEPYFDNFELRDRKTIFEKNTNIIRFIFSTPFTPEGNPHGELHEQFKRKTILTTSNHFPYVKTRIQVVDRKQIVLTPIEVAIEDVQKKIHELEVATHQDPPDPKILQMVLQGCIGTTVNQGPMEMANVFLKDLIDGTKAPTKHQNKLRLCFKDFSKKCEDALKRNKKLITLDQKEYQKELEKNYVHFQKSLAPLFSTAQSRQSPSRSLQRPEDVPNDL